MGYSSTLARIVVLQTTEEGAAPSYPTIWQYHVKLDNLSQGKKSETRLHSLAMEKSIR